jgi:hypothetical protein
MWYVEYKVPTVTGDTIYRAGPYSDEDVDFNFRDIDSFAGVTEARRVREAA